jgi:hypothetical protein
MLVATSLNNVNFAYANLQGDTLGNVTLKFEACEVMHEFQMIVNG